jgi:Putative zinc-finger
MNCREIAEIAPLYLSGELEEEGRVSFEEHLASCRDCASDMEQQRANDARLREACSELPDASFAVNAARRRIHDRRPARWALIAAGVVIVAFFGYRVLQPERVYWDAATDHRLEVTKGQPRRWRTDPAEIEKLADRYQLANVARLAPAGYRLEHAKMCGLGGKPALHLVFTNGSQEMSVFVRTRMWGSNGMHESDKLASFQNDRLAVIATGGSGEECAEFARAAARIL